MIKKKYLIGFISLFAIVILCTFLLFLISPSSIFSLITPETNLENENIGGIYLNQNIRQIEKDHFSEEINNPNTYKFVNGIRVITDDKGTIKNIAITHDTDKTIKTSRGVTVGSSLEDVVSYYGESFYNRSEQGVRIIVYVYKRNYIEFWHWDNKVQEIRYGKKPY